MNSIPPLWYSRVRVSPLFHQRMIAADASAVIEYLDGQIDAELRFVFESEPSTLSLLVGRQVVNEILGAAIPAPGQRWQRVQRMVQTRKLLLFSAELLSFARAKPLILRIFGAGDG